MQNDSVQDSSVNFSADKEEIYKRVFKRSPLISSMSVGWDNLDIVYDRDPPGEISKISFQQHCIGIFTEAFSSTEIERNIDGRLLKEENVRGNFVIVPGDVSHQVVWDKPISAVKIAIEPRIFAQTIYEVIDPDRIELLPQFATPDPLVHQIGLSLKSALTKNGNGSRLYAETLINALILHLLENYSGDRRNFSECITGKLPKYKLKRVINYIYAHFDGDLSLKELASCVQMSPTYFSRLFKETTGITPHQYVIRCRIARAKDLLKQGKLSIAEVAIQVGFVDQSHLHRYFKRLVGVTPKAFLQEFRK